MTSEFCPDYPGEGPNSRTRSSANKKPPEKVANKKAAGETPTAFY